MKKKRLLALLLAGALAAQSGAALAAEIDISDSEDAAQEFVIGDDEQEEEVVTPAEGEPSEENTEEEINVQDIEVVDAPTVNSDIGDPELPKLGIGRSELESGKYYRINDDGITLTESNEDDYHLYYEVKEDIPYLTLKDATIKSSVYVPGNTVMTVEGENSIEGGTGIQVRSAGAFTLQGNGKLIITPQSEGINSKANGDVNIKGSVQLTIKNFQSAAIYIKNGDLLVSENAVVKLGGTGGTSISCEDSIILSDEANMEATTLIESSKKVVVQNKAVLNVSSKSGCAIRGSEGVEILDDANVTAKGSTGGISSFYGSIVVEGTADVSATSYNYAAINAGLDRVETPHQITVTGDLTVSGLVGIGLMYGTITIDGGTVRANDCTLMGIYVMKNGSIEIKDADVQVKSDQYGIYAVGGSLDIIDSTVVVNAEAYPFLQEPSLTFTKGPEVYAGSDTENSLVKDLNAKVYTSNTYVKIQPHDNHKLTKVAAIDATCEQTGRIEHYICGVCDKLFADEQGTKEIDPRNIDTDKVEHSPAAAVRENEVAATCTKDGSYDEVVYCADCGQEMSRETKTVKALGHDYGSWTTTKSATCTEKGAEQRVCKNDKTHVETREIQATGHDYGEWTVTTEATCTKAGAETRICKNDKTHTETREIAKLAHNYKTTTTKAQPGKNGSTVTKCTVCGDVKSTTTISAPKTVTLSKTSYTYSGKAKKPTVTVKDANGKKIASSDYTVSYASGRKNIGTYKVTVKFKGTKYTGSLTKSFTINPKAAKIKQASNLVKGFKVTWSKTSNITGYQIQYATGKSFKNAKTVTASKSATSKKITGLKTGSISKKYYVRVRTYKTVNGKKYYSSWSSVKSAHAVRYSK
ncbi:MAG: MBG domain-containing protein [Eubacteriales bacterium]|nr:MBG domain-containing protein [Eubacteriales bacterium]